MKRTEQNLLAVHASACAFVAKQDRSLTPDVDAFWSLYLQSALTAGEAERDADDKVTVARMGYGSVAVGGCLSEETGEPGIIYLALDSAREIDSDTTDVYPVGSRPGPDRVLAYVSFRTAEAVDQTISILEELKAKHWPATIAAQDELSSTVRGAAQAEAVPSLTYPADFTDELQWILGLLCFRCITYAQTLRKAGRDIPNKAEAEQAATLDWMLRHYLRDPENWRDTAAAELRAMAAPASSDEGQS
ncbi:hypothetical protein BCh11DRAFT_00283 [Burkholderia sp. Ch1-1]|nr:hypothetical protein BCh11DRAFT_00283 [Burkholderia sp. Ch1-1]